MAGGEHDAFVQEFFSMESLGIGCDFAMPDAAPAESLSLDAWNSAFSDVFERTVLFCILGHEEQEREWGGVTYPYIAGCMNNWWRRFEWELIGNAFLYVVTCGFWNRLEWGFREDVGKWFLSPHAIDELVRAAVSQLVTWRYLEKRYIPAAQTDAYFPTPFLIRYLNIFAEEVRAAE